MSLVSLCSNQYGFLATEKLVYSAEELSQVTDAIELATQLQHDIESHKASAEDAQQAGYAAGYEAGVLQAKDDQAQVLKDALAQLLQSRQEDVKQQRNACASLAVDIVRKIANKVAPDDWLYAEAQTAALEIENHAGLVLRVHPTNLEDFADRAKRSEVFERVIADDTVEAGQCFIDTNVGSIEVDLENQISKVLHLLTSGASDD